MHRLHEMRSNQVSYVDGNIDRFKQPDLKFSTHENRMRKQLIDGHALDGYRKGAEEWADAP